MTTIGLTPEVDAFVAAVRACFADLDPDEREDLLDGLEADTADLVAERGPEALGDPAAYAAELRAAAGLAPRVRRRSWSTTTPASALDEVAARWSRLLDSLPLDLGAAVRAARPAWWVFRAWLAVMFVSYTFLLGVGRPDVAWLPTSSWGIGLLLVAAASIVSIQIGRGVLWPGTPGLLPRVVLLALNVFALLVTFETFQQVRYEIEGQVFSQYASYDQAVGPRGLSYNGTPVTNLFPYDAAGNPLVGVQLVDGEGRRLRIDAGGLDDAGTGPVLSPWLNGRSELFNVFPLPEQERDSMTWEGIGTPALPTPPFAGLPPVTLAGVTPTETRRPDQERIGPTRSDRADAKKRRR